MKLIDDYCTVDKIMLDPLNPRFGTNSGETSQSLIMKRLLDKKESKELMHSMNENIKWISKIVLRPINTLSVEEIKQYPSEIDNYEYIVVEGNTRLACLKSNNLTTFNIDEEIPVLIALKEENEKHISYLNELKITQGISNVMVVKQWGEIAKAKHLFEFFNSKVLEYNSDNLASIIKEISSELGMSTVDVRKSINRYAFYKEINEVSDTIPDKHWGYLEALDKNKAVREKIGMVDKSIEFEWNLEDDEKFPYLDIKKELLKEIPLIIRTADEDGLNTKQFRDVFVNLISDKEDKDLEEFKDRLLDTTDIKDRKENWVTLFERYKNGSKSLEEEWSRKINDVKIYLSELPLQTNWVINEYKELIEISNILENAIEIIEFRNKKKSNRNK